MTTEKKLPPTARQLQIVRDLERTEARQFADLVTDGEVANATTALRYAEPDQGEISLTDLVESLHAHGQAVNRGDLAAAERMLSGQAVALNAIFGEMARRAHLNIGAHLGATESYMRLALKAQSQSRATVEALAAIKNPPVVFARQANINNGGQQQVNNGVAQGAVECSARAREGKTSGQTKLLGGIEHGGEELDIGAAGTATRGHQVLEAVGTIHRTQKPRRKSEG